MVFQQMFWQNCCCEPKPWLTQSHQASHCVCHQETHSLASDLDEEWNRVIDAYDTPSVLMTIGKTLSTQNLLPNIS